MPDSNGWSNYKNVILHRFDEQKRVLEKLETNIEVMNGKLNKYIIDFEVFKKEIKIKAGFWGAVSGSIPVLISILIGLLFYLIQIK